jgi:hypothetical protein
MIGVDSCVFFNLYDKSWPNKWVNSGEIDPFRKISCGIGIRFFNLYDKSPETLWELRSIRASRGPSYMSLVFRGKKKIPSSLSLRTGGGHGKPLSFTFASGGWGVPCSWARGCAVSGWRTPPLERWRARARVRRSRVACIGVRAVSIAGRVRARPHRGLHWRDPSGRGDSWWASGAETTVWGGAGLPDDGGGHRGARCCCAGGMRVRRRRCAMHSEGLRLSSSQHARMLAGGVEGVGVQSVQRTDTCSAMRWWSLLSDCVYRRLSASCNTGWRQCVRRRCSCLSVLPRCCSEEPLDGCDNVGIQSKPYWRGRWVDTWISGGILILF